MDLNTIPLFAALSRRMAWLTDRQQVLAQNVANADTPNYRSRDLKAPTFAELIGQSGGTLKLVATEPNHLEGVGSQSDFRSEEDQNVVLSPAGNGVVIEDQMLKVSNTATDYQLTTSLYKQHIAMLKTVLSKGS